MYVCYILKHKPKLTIVIDFKKCQNLRCRLNETLSGFFLLSNLWKRAKSPLNNNGLLSVSLFILLLFLQKAPLCSSFSNPSNFAFISVEFEKKVYRAINNVILRFRIIFFSWRRVQILPSSHP